MFVTLEHIHTSLSFAYLGSLVIAVTNRVDPLLQSTHPRNQGKYSGLYYKYITTVSDEVTPQFGASQNSINTLRSSVTIINYDRNMFIVQGTSAIATIAVSYSNVHGPKSVCTCVHKELSVTGG